MNRRGWRRVAGLLLATLVAAGAGASPIAVRTAQAAGPLRIAADSTYTLDAAAGRVHVATRFRVTNLKPSTPTIVYYYRDLVFGVQPEAKQVRATDGAGGLSVTTRKREFFIEVEVHLRANLYYRQTSTFTLRYDLVAGPPRSEAPVRIGAAFATFGVWAWGDPGRSTVEVRTPKGFGSQFDGDPMEIETSTTGQVLRAEPADPDTFYAVITAENRAAYGSTRLSLPGDVEILVLSWPEDDEWEDTVSRTLRAGVPELLELIALPWPVEHDLNVRERYTPALEGYAGIFFVDEQRIDVSEDLDPVVIMHETSHAWFNQDLFSDRWVYEGLAEEYAWRVQTAVGGGAGEEASAPDLDDPGYVALSSWAFPQVIRDQETDDRERYGYQAAYWVVHEIVREVGIEDMQVAFAAAQADRTAYPGAGEPETVASADSWRRLLDLVEDPAGDDLDLLDELLTDYVLRANDIRDLGDRRDARDEYRNLLEAGDGWLPPWYVREPMGKWDFELATDRIQEAVAALELRDQVATAAAALSLTPADALRSAYEGAQVGLEGASAIAGDQLEALAAVEAARAKVDAQPDLVASIGLIGETPRAPYEEARAAFERGDLAGSMTAAAAAAAIVGGAAAVGQGRIVMAVVAVVVLLALVVLVIVLRRRGRRRALAFPGAGSVPLDESAAPEPSGTLAADPVAAPSPPSASLPELEGGHAPGESPPDP